MAEDLNALWEATPTKPTEDLQSLWDSTPGGAAIVQPRQPPRPLRGATGTELATDIAGATALGTVGGLVTPQILQAGGTALKGSGMPLLQSLGGGFPIWALLPPPLGQQPALPQALSAGLGRNRRGKPQKQQAQGRLRRKLHGLSVVVLRPNLQKQRLCSPLT